MKPILRALAISFTLSGFAHATPPKTGTATGTVSDRAESPVALKFAAAFVDVKDEEKPTIVILSDVEVKVAGWTSDFDLIRCKTAFSGVVFYVNKDHTSNRTSFYWKGEQSSVSGYFTLKLDPPNGKEFTGTVATDTKKADQPHADAAFHVTVK